jgi:hypothetical protein
MLHMVSVLLNGNGCRVCDRPPVAARQVIMQHCHLDPYLFYLCSITLLYIVKPGLLLYPQPLCTAIGIRGSRDAHNALPVPSNVTVLSSCILLRVARCVQAAGPPDISSFPGVGNARSAGAHLAHARLGK